MATKNVLIACGNGVATSTVVRSKIEKYCAEQGISIKATQCKMLEIHDKGNDYDLVVTSGKFKDPDVKTPCIRPSTCSPALTRRPLSRRSPTRSRTSATAPARARPRGTSAASPPEPAA